MYVCLCVCQCVVQVVSSIQSLYQQRAAQVDDVSMCCACTSVCVCQCVVQAVSSIQSVYQQRAARADDWRNSQLLSLLSDSNKIMMVAHTDCVRARPAVSHTPVVTLPL